MDQLLSDSLFLLVIFMSNTIQILTGFGGNMLAMPPSIKLIGINEARTVLNVFDLIACLILWIKNRQYVNKKIFIKIIFFMIIGMIIGMWFIKIVPVDFLLKTYSILIISIAIYKMIINKSIEPPNIVMIFIILLAGIIHSIFLSGGALLVIYAVSVLKDKREFRATLSPVWVVLAVILVFSPFNNGYYTKNTVILIFLSIIPLIASVWLGNKLFKYINQELFLKITYVLLLISGISLLL